MTQYNPDSTHLIEVGGRMKRCYRYPDSERYDQDSFEEHVHPIAVRQAREMIAKDPSLMTDVLDKIGVDEFPGYASAMHLLVFGDDPLLAAQFVKQALVATIDRLAWDLAEKLMHDEEVEVV